MTSVESLGAVEGAAQVQRVGREVAGWTARQRPRPGPFRGRHTAVVPLRPDHADELRAGCAGPGTEPLWTYLADGPFDDPVSFDAWVAGRAEDPSTEAVAVLDPRGRAAGLASLMRIDTVHGCVEIGGVLFGHGVRRTPAATEAVYLLARHVFDDLGYRRLEWKCDALNLASRAAAERLGFRYEGTFRQAMVYKGRNRDTAWFSLLDQDWPPLRAALEQWLHPDNFDPSGGQRQRLAEIRARVGTATTEGA